MLFGAFCSILWLIGLALTLVGLISILRHLRFGAVCPARWEKVNAES